MPNCLADDNENDARLRETLRILALLACHWYGSAVLLPK